MLVWLKLVLLQPLNTCGGTPCAARITCFAIAVQVCNATQSARTPAKCAVAPLVRQNFFVKVTVVECVSAQEQLYADVATHSNVLDSIPIYPIASMTFACLLRLSPFNELGFQRFQYAIASWSKTRYEYVFDV